MVLRVDCDRVVELDVVPIKEHFDVLRHVPGDADVGHPQAVGVAGGVGDSVGKDLVADIKVIVAAEDFPGARDRTDPAGC